ncbi:MAG TPA: FAD-binding protein, partial [Gammaproteobacteria bacterium]|nr:FAD-binding protein [Gammaproteobacteria bacterium]
MTTKHASVVVVGGGSAAFEAAVAAKQAGAPSVIMLEKAPEAEFGGNARFSHTGFRFVYSGADEIRRFLPDMDEASFSKLQLPGYRPEHFTADLMRVTRGRINKDLAEVLVNESNGAIHWMRELGIQWEPAGSVEIDGKRYFEPGIVIHPTGGVGGGVSQL